MHRMEGTGQDAMAIDAAQAGLVCSRLSCSEFRVWGFRGLGVEGFRGLGFRFGNFMLRFWGFTA